MRTAIRVGNFSGYAGDRSTGLSEAVAGDPVDVLTGDYLAEISLAPLSAAYARHPARGYVESFRAQLRPHLGVLAERGVKVVTNAGGFNPAGLAAALTADLQDEGLTPRVAHVVGDDVFGRLAELQADGHGLAHLDTGAQLATWGRQPTVANAYLGAWGIAEALAQGADIVVCGRVTDASLTVGPAAWWHGWGREDWDELAGAVVAGHVIECGGQAQGGNFSGTASWAGVTRFGFPIAEVAADGSSVITMHTGQQGRVTCDTVTAQLLYEIQGPRYLNPDVTVHLEDVQLEQVGPDRVAVTGTTGSPPPPTTKVALFAGSGWQTVQWVFVTAPDVTAKVRLLEEQLRLDLRPGVELTVTQVGAADPAATDQWGATVAVRLFASAPTREELDAFALATRTGELYLSSFAGFYTDIAVPPKETRRERVEYWPGLLAQDVLAHQVVLPNGEVLDVPAPTVTELPVDPGEPVPQPIWQDEPTVRRALGDVVHARSGDKGGNSNVGVWTADDRAWPWLRSTLTADLVRQLLPETAGLEITRHEFPRLRAVHVVLKGLLGSGGSSNDRMDQIGKAVGEYLRSREVDVPTRLLTGE